MSIAPWMIAALLVAVLLVAMLALRELFYGYEQQRALVSRTALDEAERRANSRLVRLDSWLRRTQLGRTVEGRILASGVRIRVSTFLIMIAAAAAAAIYVIGEVLGWLLGGLAAVAVGWVFFRYLRSQEEKRREAFIAQLPEIARVLSNATSAGLAMRTALEMAADEIDEPASAELRYTSERLSLGQPTDDALRELGERMPSRELSVLVSTLLVSSRAGGALVSALRNISETLEGRKEVRREVKTTFTQPVYTGYLVAGIGVASLFLMNMVSPGVIEEMTQSLIGIAVLAVSGGLFALGLILVRRATRIDI